MSDSNSVNEDGVVGNGDAPVLKRLGTVPYLECQASMRHYSETRDRHSADELWLVEHPPVYTRGQRLQDAAGATVDSIDGVPVVQSDRGGDMTYHGPGQLVIYLLLDLRRRGLGVRQVVHSMESAVIDLLADYGITGERRQSAPGVYVFERKIAALGLRVRRGCSYHGLSLNVDMDLAPFARIDPCGYPDLEVTQLADLGVGKELDAVADGLVAHLLRLLGYTGAPREHD